MVSKVTAIPESPNVTTRLPHQVWAARMAPADKDFDNIDHVHKGSLTERQRLCSHRI